MRKALIAMAALALCGGVAFSQSQLDAYKYAQRDLNGTARYLGMGGAFGALGGDISAMKGNPAGLAVYRSSEIVTTMSLSSISAKTNWLGATDKNDRTRFNFDNIAYVGYFPTSNDEGIVSWNAGFAYNRIKNYRRSYSTTAGAGLDFSISDYLAGRAYGYGEGELAGTDNYDPYNNNKPNSPDWLSVLGYNAGFMDYSDNLKDYYSPFGDYDSEGNWVPCPLERGTRLSVNEHGSIDEYDISLGMNISDIVLLGATVAITDLNYELSTTYDESFTNGSNLYLDNGLNTDGTGYAFNLGAIVRPTDYLRLGVAYNSPTWYKMTDYYYGEAASKLIYRDGGSEKIRELSDHSPKKAYTDYEYRSPDKWLFSAAAVIGQAALLSVDYELVNYKNMRMYDHNGNANIDTNNDIEGNFKMGTNLRVGAEVKVTPQFAVRAGAAWSNSPVKSLLKSGELEVRTVGTIPNYTIDKGMSNYTVGFGYRFTPRFYTDLACVLTNYKEDVYAFSPIENVDGWVIPQAASLKTKTTRVALTLGYKF